MTLEDWKDKVQDDCSILLEQMERNIRKGDDLLSVAKEAVLMETFSTAVETEDFFSPDEKGKIIDSPNIAFDLIKAYQSCDADINICNKKEVLLLLCRYMGVEKI